MLVPLSRTHTVDQSHPVAVAPVSVLPLCLSGVMATCRLTRTPMPVPPDVPTSDRLVAVAGICHVYAPEAFRSQRIVF